MVGISLRSDTSRNRAVASPTPMPIRAASTSLPQFISRASRNMRPSHAVPSTIARLAMRPAIPGKYHPPRSQDEREAGMYAGLGRVGQVSRTVGVIARAQAWYGEVLELELLYTLGNLAFFDLAGTG